MCNVLLTPCSYVYSTGSVPAGYKEEGRHLMCFDGLHVGPSHVLVERLIYCSSLHPTRYKQGVYFRQSVHKQHRMIAYYETLFYHHECSAVSLVHGVQLRL